MTEEDLLKDLEATANLACELVVLVKTRTPGPLHGLVALDCAAAMLTELCRLGMEPERFEAMAKIRARMLPGSDDTLTILRANGLKDFS